MATINPEPRYPAPKLTDDDPMPFGKHAGKPMREVPADYLDWFSGECQPHKAGPMQLAVLNYINDNRAYIDADLEDTEQE